MFGTRSLKELKHVVGLVLGLLFLKLILVLFSQTTDPDAVVRILQSKSWLEDPNWIGFDVWGPFNYYLNAFGLWIYNDVVISPKLINILFSVATILPLYGMLRIRQSHLVSILVVVLFTLSPLILRNSFIAMTETPYLFFVAFSMWQIMRFFTEGQNKHLIGAGLFITIAAGFRYEAWAIMFVFWLILLLKKDFKKSLLFAGIAGVFPLIWLVSNYIYTGDFLWSLKGNNHWTLEVMGTNESVSFEEWARRVWFIPFMFFIGLGPVFMYVFLKGGKVSKQKIWWIPIGFVFVLLMFKSVNGTLLHHPRFVATLLLLCLPIIAGGINWLVERSHWKMYFTLGIVVQLAGSYVYNVDHIEPFPLLKDQKSLECLELIQRIGTEKKCVFIDFIGWEETYYYALLLTRTGNEVYIVGGYDTYDQVEMKFREFAKSEGDKWVVSNALLDENEQNCASVNDFYTAQRAEELILLTYQ